MSMFGSYPLSRLGTGSALAASLTSVSSVTARGSSVASSSSAKTNAEALAAHDRAKNGGKGGEQKGDKATTGEPVGAIADGSGNDGASAGEAVVEAATNAGNTVASSLRMALQRLVRCSARKRSSASQRCCWLLWRRSYWVR